MRAPAATQKLLESVASKDLAGFNLALMKGADLLAKDLSGHNALALSLVHGPEDLILVVLGATMNASPDGDWLFEPLAGGHTNPLGLMVSNHRYRALSAVLSLGEGVLSRLDFAFPASGETLAHLAVREDSGRALTMLMKACPSLVAPHPGRSCALGLAVGLDNVKLVGELLDAGVSPLNETSPAWTRVESMKMMELLSAQVNWEQVRTPEGRALSHVLAARGSALKGSLWRAVYRRFPHHALCADATGRTPLHEAIEARASAELVDDLLEAGARWGAQDARGKSPASILEEHLSTGWSLPGATVERWRAMVHAQALDKELSQPSGVTKPPARL